MADEHERKFLLRSIPKKHLTQPEAIRQGYLHAVFQAKTRIRIKGENAFITIKGTRTGITRTEYEYEIPIQDAQDMLKEFVSDKRQIMKTRYYYTYKDQEFVIDVFEGENQGLVVAELEVSDPESPISLPNQWDCVEVTDKEAFYNDQLCSRPVSQWSNKPSCTLT